MIPIKTPDQIKLMRKSGKILARTLELVRQKVRAGTRGEDLDELARKYIKSQGAKPAFRGYHGYPANICLSVNEAIVHGLPQGQVIKPGDVVKVDIGVNYRGWNTDAAMTILVDPIDPINQKMLATAQRALNAGIKKVRHGVPLGDIQSAIELEIIQGGYGNIKSLTGHGIGQSLHEPPSIPNFGRAGSGPILQSGMVICLEPMLSVGDDRINTLRDGWTICTSDGSMAVHVEDTILVTNQGAEILTQ